MTNFIAPQHGMDAFHCPTCGVYAHQLFAGAMRTMGGNGPFASALTQIERYTVSVCSRCSTPAIWHDQKIVHPNYGSTPTAHPDMPRDVAGDYEEARLVADLSPRAAAALLRLALQKLCIALGQDGRRLDDDIRALVAVGLDTRIQRSLDILRITGNNAVHPGELDIKDDRLIVSKLFVLLNTIVQAMITQPKEIDSLWDAMPGGARDAVQRRDEPK